MCRAPAPHLHLCARRDAPGTLKAVASTERINSNVLWAVVFLQHFPCESVLPMQNSVFDRGQFAAASAVLWSQVPIPKPTASAVYPLQDKQLKITIVTQPVYFAARTPTTFPHSVKYIQENKKITVSIWSITFCSKRRKVSLERGRHVLQYLTSPLFVLCLKLNNTLITWWSVIITLTALLLVIITASTLSFSYASIYTYYIVMMKTH